jgi:hypothetical protein
MSLKGWGGHRVASLLVVAFFAAGSISVVGASDELSYELRSELSAAMQQKLRELSNIKDANGNENVRGTYSKDFRKVDDDTYMTSVHVDTAEPTTMITERFDVTLKREGGRWSIASEELRDTQKLLHRVSGYACYPFDSFSFDKEGLRLSAKNGGVCEYYYEGTVSGFDLMGAGGTDHSYEYSPPEHLNLIQQSHDFYALDKVLKQDHSDELEFNAKGFTFNCDPETCEELLNTAFTGLERIAPEERKPGTEIYREGIPNELRRYFQKEIAEIKKDRKENAFRHYRRPYREGNDYYRAGVWKSEDHQIGITYNNWGGYEVKFWVYQDSTDDEALYGDVFGYYTEETLQKQEAYQIERRDDVNSRWYEVYSVKGEVEAAIDNSEMVKGDIEFGLTVKQDLQELPFFIASIPRGDGENFKRSTLWVNSVQHNGQELTWVKTSPFSGIVVLPEPVPAGTRINLRMDFATRALYKRNHAYYQMNRFGWMPFVRFADFIDEFELTINVPDKYTLLGIGHKVEERVEDGISISTWKAGNPVVFPTIIFGKYISDKPKFDAKKSDGTVIPVAVHVDEVSMNQLDFDVTSMEQLEEFDQAIRSGALGIRTKQLRPIAEQAANSINLYTEISGVDYPYGALNLVNDPVPALYGQAPSSLIYLGSLVFRGEGTMAGDTIMGGGGTSTAKFLKSVTAHEVGHQWWGSRVSNANDRNYWFVESLAEYFSALYLQYAFDDAEYQDQVDDWRNAILDVRRAASVQDASTLWSGEDGFRSYQTAVYSKGPYAFHMLREMFGDEKFFPFLKQFSMELAEKREIVTRDIQVAAEKALGGIDENGNPYNVDLEWFFDQWIRGSGIPQYKFDYDVRRTEDGSYLVEGTIRQRVVLGSGRNFEVLDGKYYAGVVNVQVLGKKNKEYESRILIQGAETPFKLKVPEKPLEVALNKDGGILAHDVVVNQSW